MGYINWSKYGALVRYERRKHHCKTAGMFSDIVSKQAGVSISRDTIYKIEQGRQVPNAEQFMAINLVLFGKVWPDDVKELLTIA